MDLEVGQELEFVGLQRADDLGLEVRSGTALSDDVRTEDLHLIVGKVCIGQNGLYLYKTFAELLVRIPEMGTDGEATA